MIFDACLRTYHHLQYEDHFHVHIVNANYEGVGMGMAVGQAHLLEDVISLVSNSFLLPHQPPTPIFISVPPEAGTGCPIGWARYIREDHVDLRAGGAAWALRADEGSTTEFGLIAAPR